MNNSVPALCRALIRSLGEEVLPHVADPFARGQLAAAIYVLSNFERAAAWSSLDIERETQRAREAAAEARARMAELGIAVPRGALLQTPLVVDGATHDNVEAARNAANADLCALFDVLADRAKGGHLTAEQRAVEAELLTQAATRVQEEKRRDAPSLMKQMRGG